MAKLSQQVTSVADIAQGCSKPPVYFSSPGKAHLGSSGTQGSTPCPARWLTLLITTSDGVKMRMLSPGLAGLMWVSSVTGCRVVQRRVGAGWGLEAELLG